MIFTSSWILKSCCDGETVQLCLDIQLTGEQCYECEGDIYRTTLGVSAGNSFKHVYLDSQHNQPPYTICLGVNENGGDAMNIIFQQYCELGPQEYGQTICTSQPGLKTIRSCDKDYRMRVKLICTCVHRHL